VSKRSEIIMGRGEVKHSELSEPLGDIASLPEGIEKGALSGSCLKKKRCYPLYIITHPICYIVNLQKRFYP
jgi:hypothetical protein